MACQQKRNAAGSQIALLVKASRNCPKLRFKDSHIWELRDNCDEFDGFTEPSIASAMKIFDMGGSAIAKAEMPTRRGRNAVNSNTNLEPKCSSK